MRFTFLIASAVVAVASASQLVMQPTVMAPLNPAPLSETQIPVDDAYIVVLKDGIESAFLNTAAARTEKLSRHVSWLQSTLTEFNVAEQANALFASQMTETYDFGAFQGYAGSFTPSVLAAIRANPEVAFVDQDVTVHLNAAVMTSSSVVGQASQNNATWGLARLSHKGRVSGRPDAVNYEYLYDSNAVGSGVDVYIVDTGVNIVHPDFNGRAVWGKTTAPGSRNSDGNGHGTHVAGIIGATTYGVAKDCNLIAVKVLSDAGSGQLSWIIKGIEFVLNSHKANNANGAKKARKSVANMSLGGQSMPTIDAAVNSAVSGGVVFVVAGGNDNRDACKYSPAAAEKAITVAASDINDSRAYFSNWGKCIDIFAPGHQIISTYMNRVESLSGTSMASPFVAGAAAAVFSGMSDDSTVDEVKSKLMKMAEKGSIMNVAGSPNVMLRSN